MDQLEVIARLKIRPGELETFKAQAAEVLRATREKDTHTLRCDWYIDAEGTACEVHETFPNEQGLIEHKIDTMEPSVALFERSGFDHHASIYGTVSQDFIDLATARMGKPDVFAFFQGLGSQASPSAGSRERFEVIARLKVRPGALDNFTSRVAEILRLTREQDTQTLRYDWFLNEEQSACEVHEAYIGEAGLIAHNDHVMEARSALFRDAAFDHRMSVYGEISDHLAFDHRMSVYGEISDHLADLFAQHAGGVSRFSCFQGLERGAAV